MSFHGWLGVLLPVVALVTSLLYALLPRRTDGRDSR